MRCLKYETIHGAGLVVGDRDVVFEEVLVRVAQDELVAAARPTVVACKVLLEDVSRSTPPHVEPEAAVSDRGVLDERVHVRGIDEEALKSVSSALFPMSVLLDPANSPTPSRPFPVALFPSRRF